MNEGGTWMSPCMADYRTEARAEAIRAPADAGHDELERIRRPLGLERRGRKAMRGGAGQEFA